MIAATRKARDLVEGDTIRYDDAPHSVVAVSQVSGQVRLTVRELPDGEPFEVPESCSEICEFRVHTGLITARDGSLCSATVSRTTVEDLEAQHPVPIGPRTDFQDHEVPWTPGEIARRDARFARISGEVREIQSAVAGMRAVGGVFLEEVASFCDRQALELSRVNAAAVGVELPWHHDTAPRDGEVPTAPRRALLIARAWAQEVAGAEVQPTVRVSLYGGARVGDARHDGPSPLALEYARARATGDRGGMVRVFGELFGADAAATFGEVLDASAAGEPDDDQDAGAGK